MPTGVDDQLSAVRPELYRGALMDRKLIPKLVVGMPSRDVFSTKNNFLYGCTTYRYS
eukprot:SAG31_NODE_5908_length_2262_cov_5.163662_2_plen_57_part_00